MRCPERVWLKRSEHDAGNGASGSSGDRHCQWSLRGGSTQGDLTHRRFGWLLAGSLLGVNVTALFIYNLTGEFGPFHVFAIVSLASVLLGVGHAPAAPARTWVARTARLRDDLDLCWAPVRSGSGGGHTPP